MTRATWILTTLLLLSSADSCHLPPTLETRNFDSTAKENHRNQNHVFKHSTYMRTRLERLSEALKVVKTIFLTLVNKLLKSVLKDLLRTG